MVSFHGLGAPQLGIVLGHVDGGTAQVAHGHLEGHPGAGGGFFENKGHGSPLEQVRPELYLLHFDGPGHHGVGLGRGHVVDFQESFRHTRLRIIA